MPRQKPAESSFISTTAGSEIIPTISTASPTNLHTLSRTDGTEISADQAISSSALLTFAGMNMPSEAAFTMTHAGPCGQQTTKTASTHLTGFMSGWITPTPLLPRTSWLISSEYAMRKNIPHSSGTKHGRRSFQAQSLKEEALMMSGTNLRLQISHISLLTLHTAHQSSSAATIFAADWHKQ